MREVKRLLAEHHQVDPESSVYHVTPPANPMAASDPHQNEEPAQGPDEEHTQGAPPSVFLRVGLVRWNKKILTTKRFSDFDFNVPATLDV